MRPFLSCLALVLLLPQCGGGTAAGGSLKSAADGSQNSEDSGEGSGESLAKQDDDGTASSESSTASKSRGVNCDDGTCSKCGSGICPAGWYCDEKASGGGACSWLTECADKPSCACVTRVLGASCACREEGGGLKVACE